MIPTTLLAQSEGIGIELITRVGGICAAIAAVGLLLVLPLYLIHRSEVNRLLRWRELEPERGEGEGGEPPVAPPGSGPVTPTGGLSPVERVTVDRPALERITAERAALESPSFWRRFLAGGPRHPLVISAAALVASVLAVAGVYLALSANGEDAGGGGGLDRSEVEVVVLNGSSQEALAAKVGETLQVAGFDIVGTRTTFASEETLVLFARGEQRAARAVARELGEGRIQPMNRQIRAAAEGAQVVVVAGDDRAGGGDGDGRQDGRAG